MKKENLFTILLVCIVILVLTKGFTKAGEIHEAARKGDLATVKKLVEQGADINEMDKDGNTPLYVAAAKGHMEIVRYLTEHKATPKTQDKPEKKADAKIKSKDDKINEVSKIFVNVEVNNPVIKELSTWDSDIVFFTSIKNPIKKLEDIKNPQGEVGTWGFELFRPVKELLKVAGIETDGILTIGNGNFDNLFIERPKLKLFATKRSSFGCQNIVNTGGGIEVKFITQEVGVKNKSKNDESVVDLADEARDLFNRGVSHYQNKELDKALECFDKVLKLNDEDASAWMHKALVLNDIGMYQLGEDTFAKAISLNSKEPYYYANRSLCRFKNGNYEEALSDLDKAIKYGFPPNKSNNVFVIQTILRQLYGYEYDDLKIPPKDWKPNPSKYCKDVVLEEVVSGYLKDKGLICFGSSGRLAFTGTQEKPLLYAFNFFVWDGAIISDENFGVLLDNGTKFKYVKLEKDYKIEKVGIIENWKAKVTSEQKIKIK